MSYINKVQNNNGDAILNLQNKLENVLMIAYEQNDVMEIANEIIKTKESTKNNLKISHELFNFIEVLNDYNIKNINEKCRNSRLALANHLLTLLSNDTKTVAESDECLDSRIDKLYKTLELLQKEDDNKNQSEENKTKTNQDLFFEQFDNIINKCLETQQMILTKYEEIYQKIAAWTCYKTVCKIGQVHKKYTTEDERVKNIAIIIYNYNKMQNQIKKSNRNKYEIAKEIVNKLDTNIRLIRDWIKKQKRNNKVNKLVAIHLMEIITIYNNLLTDNIIMHMEEKVFRETVEYWNKMSNTKN
ncbi:hypothetical protein BDAP_000235 [Binucleata daphniae]